MKDNLRPFVLWLCSGSMNVLRRCCSVSMRGGCGCGCAAICVIWLADKIPGTNYVCFDNVVLFALKLGWLIKTRMTFLLWCFVFVTHRD